MNADWVAFAGRLHPVVLHLPIGLIAGIVLIEIASVFSTSTNVRVIRALFLWVTVASAAAAVTTGWLLGDQGYSGATLDWHRWLGISLGAALLLTAILDLSGRAGLRRLALLGVLALMTVTGHLGGTLTHGQGYLGAYAPAWARPILGEPAQAAPVASGDASIILTALSTRCYECHGAGSQKGGLRLDDIDGLMSVITPGNAPESELFHRITLAPDDLDRMPPEGEPLDDQAILAIMHWINSGAAPEDMQAGQDEARALADAKAAQLDDLRARTGALIVPVDGHDDGPLRVDYARREAPPQADHVAPLADIADRIVELSFAGQAIDATILPALPPMANLDTLHLERTGLSDDGLQGIADIAPNLVYLNLHSTQVTAASLPEISRLESLKDLFLYATGVDDEALADFRARHPDVNVTSALSLPDP